MCIAMRQGQVRKTYGTQCTNINGHARMHFNVAEARPEFCIVTVKER